MTRQVPEIDTTRPRYRDELELIARDAIESRERMAQAWMKLEDALIEARRERDAILSAAKDVVDEYLSHGGEGTHQECLPGCGCCMPVVVARLSAVIDKVRR